MRGSVIDPTGHFPSWEYHDSSLKHMPLVRNKLPWSWTILPQIRYPIPRTHQVVLVQPLDPIN
jgi:hypothetical protein